MTKEQYWKLKKLRESCVDAFTGIIQGLKGDENNPNENQVRKLESHLDFIFNFLSQIAADKEQILINLAYFSLRVPSSEDLETLLFMVLRLNTYKSE